MRPAPELDAVGDGAGDQGRGDHREHQLEHREDQDGHADGVHRRDHGGGIAEADVVLREADDPARAGLTEGQRESVERPEHAHDAETDEVHHQHVEDVLGPDEATIEERKPGVINITRAAEARIQAVFPSAAGLMSSAARSSAACCTDESFRQRDCKGVALLSESVRTASLRPVSVRDLNLFRVYERELIYAVNMWTGFAGDCPFYGHRTTAVLPV